MKLSDRSQRSRDIGKRPLGAPLRRRAGFGAGVAAACLLGVLLAAAVQAEPTVLDVHVLSRGAKFVGSSVGGALVTIEDAASGEVLAQGPTEGGTGDTDRIMREARDRDTELVTPDAARFTARLELAEPTRVRVSAYGPLDYPASANTVTATAWLLPGQQLTDSSPWILEMPGLVVDIEAIERSTAGIAVKVHVAMMCGCPLTQDGLWPKADFHVEGALVRDGRPVARVPLRHTGEDSEFAGELEVSGAGIWELQVTAAQRSTGNAGSVRTRIGAL